MDTLLLYHDTDGNEVQVVIGAQSPAVYIGCGTECDVRSSDASLSRRHASVTLVGDRWWITALDTEVLINGRRIARTELLNDDLIQCGALHVRFVDGRPDARRERTSGAAPHPSLLSPPLMHVPSDVPPPPVRSFTGAVVTQPSGPDASPPGGRKV